MGAEESALLWEQMDMGAVTKDMDRLFPSFSFEAEAIFADILRGDLWEAVKKTVDGLLGAVLFQRGELRTLFLTILVLGVAAALFSNFADLFQNHQVSDIAFYLIYLLLVAVLLRFFADTAGIVQDMLQNVTTFIKLYVPAYILAVGSASGAATATAGYQLLLAAVFLIEWGYLSLLLPFVHAYVLLTVINGVWSGEKLSQLLELLAKLIGGCIKASLWMVTGFSLLQSMISPVIDSLQSSVMKRALSSIPGLGDLTGGMFEMVMGSAVLVKNSLGVYITLTLLALCAVPLLKIALMFGVIKLSAALIGIISDKRLTNCVSRMGEGNMMLLKMAMASVGMFVIQVAVITYSVGQAVR